MRLRMTAPAMHVPPLVQPGAQARFVRIYQAYETLSDPVQRTQYNQELRRKVQQACAWGMRTWHRVCAHRVCALCAQYSPLDILSGYME